MEREREEEGDGLWNNNLSCLKLASTLWLNVHSIYLSLSLSLLCKREVSDRKSKGNERKKFRKEGREKCCRDELKKERV